MKHPVIRRFLYAQLVMLFMSVVINDKSAIAQQPSIPSGTYSAGPRHLVVAGNGDRTCYQGISVPSGSYSVAVGETTGSLEPRQNSLVAEGWNDYGRDVLLTLRGSTIDVTHEGTLAGDYTFSSSALFDAGLAEVLSRCLNSTEPFFEQSPGYLITMPRVNTARSLQDAPSSLPLPSGIYYTQGTMNNHSRREIWNKDGKLCIKIVEGPPSPYEGTEQITISSITTQGSQLYIDATSEEMEVFRGEALRELAHISSETVVALDDGTRRGVWELSNFRVVDESDASMQACIDAQGEYVRESEGAFIPGKL